MSSPDSVASPCIQRCCVDKLTGFCQGCLRTLEEIGAWSAASDDRKKAILMAVGKRRKELRA